MRAFKLFASAMSADEISPAMSRPAAGYPLISDGGAAEHTLSSLLRTDPGIRSRLLPDASATRALSSQGAVAAMSDMFGERLNEDGLPTNGNQGTGTDGNNNHPPQVIPLPTPMTMVLCVLAGATALARRRQIASL